MVEAPTFGGNPSQQWPLTRKAHGINAQKSPIVANPTAFTVETMTTNDHATDTLGAETSTDEVDALAQQEAISREFRDVNTKLRYEYLECNLRRQQALDAGDDEAYARATEDRERISSQFFQENQRLVFAATNTILHRNTSQYEDHVQSGVLGLWEAFVGLTQEARDGVQVAPDGTLSPTGGWDPKHGTFSTWSRQFILGQARRSLNSNEQAFAGLRYSTWQMRPRVLAAREELRQENGKEPSYREIAARAEVSAETVRVCINAAPVSLATPTTEGSTLGDVLASKEIVTGTALPTTAEQHMAELAAQLPIHEICAILPLHAIISEAPLTSTEVAALLGLSRGEMGHLVKRVNKALE